MTTRRMAPRIISLGFVLLLGFSAVAVAESETESTITSVTQSSGADQSLQFTLIPSVNGSGHGTGSAFVQVQGGFVSVHMQAEGVASGSHFALDLIANGTSYSVANMTTGSDGEVEAEASVSLSPGTYQVGLAVYDVSSSTLVLVGNPQTRTAHVGQSGGYSTTQSDHETQSISTYQGGQSEDDGIRTALRTKVIPAVVDVGESSSSTYVTDSNFSVAVGRYNQDGYQISISAANSSGPRVLLVNLTSPLARSLFANPVVITLDGVPVQQSSSFSQVMGAKAGDPSSFIVVTGASGVALLVSIPHFSYHTIAIYPVLATVAAALMVDLPILVVSALFVSMLFAVVYARRTRAPSIS